MPTQPSRVRAKPRHTRRSPFTRFPFALSPIPGNPPGMVSLPPEPIPASRRHGQNLIRSISC
jgi:hypothetical protein